MSNDKFNPAFEFEALVCEQTALSIEVKGMVAENERRATANDSPAYTDKDFQWFADESRKLADKFRQLGGAKEIQGRASEAQGETTEAGEK